MIHERDAGDGMAADGFSNGTIATTGRWPAAVIGLGNAEPREIAVQWDLEGLRLQIRGPEGEVLHRLGPFGVAEGEGVRRSLAAASGLALAEDEASAILDMVLDRSSDAVRAQVPARRRLVVLTGRRPRFLVRRKPGRVTRRPLVHREQEIAGGRGA